MLRQTPCVCYFAAAFKRTHDNACATWATCASMLDGAFDAPVSNAHVKDVHIGRDSSRSLRGGARRSRTGGRGGLDITRPAPVARSPIRVMCRAFHRDVSNVWPSHCRRTVAIWRSLRATRQTAVLTAKAGSGCTRSKKDGRASSHQDKCAFTPLWSPDSQSLAFLSDGS